MKFSIIHPTARVTNDFEHPWYHAMMSAAKGCTDKTQVEYIVVVHHSRIHDFWETFKTVPHGHTNWGRFIVVVNHGRDLLVDQGNAGLLAAAGEIIVGNQDDMRYPEGWDAAILELIPDTSQLVCVQARTDGGRPDLLQIPTIATWQLMWAIGPTSPEYESMYTDDEWSIKARELGEVIQAPHLYFQHLHPAHGTARVDSVYALENSEDAYARGHEVFLRRKFQGFPRVELPGFEVAPLEAQSYPVTDSEIETPRRGILARSRDLVSRLFGEAATAPMSPAPPLIAICTPGETFSMEWVQAFLNLGVKFGELGYACKRYMGHTSNVYRTRQDLAERVIEDARLSGETPDLVLWLDDDNVLLPEQLEGLVRFMQRYPDVDVLTGWCWIHKRQGWVTSVGRFWKEDGVSIEPMTLAQMFHGETPQQKIGPKVIEHSGFPCVMMRYAALAKLGASAFRPLVKADLAEVFGNVAAAVSVPDSWYCGEDTAWFLRAKQAGLRVVVDPGCKVAHLKLQVQEPDIVKEFGVPDSPEVALRRKQLNDAPVVAPAEYQAM